MKTNRIASHPRQAGSALIMTMIMCTVALVILGAALAWQSSNTRLTHRVIQYDRSVAAAEAATEKVVAQITRDFLYGGEEFGRQQPQRLPCEHGAHGDRFRVLEFVGF